MGLLEYSGLTAKIRAMSGKLMKKSDYEAMIQLTSVDEIIGYLRMTPGFADTFAAASMEELHRDRVEEILRASVYENFAKLYHFASAKQQKYLEMYVIRYEISILKTLIRHIYNPDTQDTDIRRYRDFFLKFSKFDIVVLNDCATVPELIDNLGKSRFYTVLRRVSEIDGVTMFDYETALDLYYFTVVWKCKDKYLKGEDLEILTGNYGREIDLLNIRWIYRAKAYYNMTPVQIYKLVVPVHYKLRSRELEALVESDGLDGFYEVLKTTYYGRREKDIENVNLEDVYMKTQEKINVSDGKKSPYSVAIINYYLYKKEEELRKLTTLLEGVRYKMDPQALSEYLGMEAT